MDFNSDGFYLTGKFIGQRTYQKQDGTHGLNVDILQKIENRNYVRNCFGNPVDLDLSDLKENQKVAARCNVGANNGQLAIRIISIEKA